MICRNSNAKPENMEMSAEPMNSCFTGHMKSLLINELERTVKTTPDSLLNRLLEDRETLLQLSLLHQRDLAKEKAKIRENPAKAKAYVSAFEIPENVIKLSVLMHMLLLQQFKKM